ncbi:MAG: DUF2141 domain-containing protein [Alphaproteobacteria bacterium]|nr:DUF2141 domain-containing protein [Alphaproteobacteria bacterium]
MKRVLRGLTAAAVFAVAFGCAGARAGNASPGLPASDLSRYAEPGAVVLAIRTGVRAAGGKVRLLGYDDPAAFLERATVKYDALVNADGVAVIPLHGLHKGQYAFLAYYDENGDGKLNRNALGRPKEPYGFSNDVRPKLHKPHFNDVKVDVAPGEVIVLTLRD